MELNGFEKAPLPVIPKALEDYLIYVAKSGNTVFPWNKIKPLMKSKLEIIIREFNESCPEGHLPKMPNVDVFKFGEMKERIMEQLESYTGTPFTIQRLCELLVQPKRHYKRTDKFMRGLEKVMLVVSTVDPITTSPNIQDNGCSLLVEREKLKVGACSQVYESPSKRIRLASAEEEGGPCDSADGATTPCVSKEAPDLCSAPGPSSLPGVSLPSTSTATASSNLPMTEVMQEPELDSMDIDTECTSSEARLSIPDRQEDSVESSIEANREEEAESSPEEGVESSQGEGRREASPEGDDWVMVEKPAVVCDSGMVSTSAEGEVGGQDVGEVVSDSSGQGGVSDSTEGEIGVSDSTEGTGAVSDSSEDNIEQVVTDSEAAAEPSDNLEQENVSDIKIDQDKSDTCSSSDQGELLNVERGEEDTNSEAEPAEEREETIQGGEENTDSAVSVQSSEERNVMISVIGAEARGAADSSDEISGAATPSPSPTIAEPASLEEAQADQPTCSEGELAQSRDKQEEVVGEGNSPDQSDTAQ